MACRQVSSASVTAGVLTTVFLVAVVRAVVVVVTSPQGRDAASVVALKLPGFTLRLRMSSCVLIKKLSVTPLDRFRVGT